MAKQSRGKQRGKHRKVRRKQEKL